MIYFISDTHFGSWSMIKLCPRPFSSVEEMDEALIANWNRKVKKGDTVYILGDLIHDDAKRFEWYLSQLNGKKILLKGNHDEEMLRAVDPPSFFSEIEEYKTTELQGHTVTLCHYPMLEWKNSRKHGSRKLGYMIHGHIHGRVSPLYTSLFSQGNALNAGVDVNGYEPVSFEELLANNERFKLATMSEPVDKALFICRSYHMHQCDKSGRAYAEHPIHVAEQFEDETHKLVALLHDTLEDTALTPERLEEIFGERVRAAVSAMTRRAGEGYFDYITRLMADPIARAVKREELKHNMDLTRLKAVTDEDLARVEKYRRALAMLLKGD